MSPNPRDGATFDKIKLMAYQRATLPEVIATKGVRPGAAGLLQVLRDRTGNHPARRPAGDGIFNKRPVRGSTTVWSLHAVSRAVDLGVTPNPAGLQLGSYLVWVLMERAEWMGIQQIIFSDGTRDVVYRPGEPPRPQKRHIHKDHLHIEIHKHIADAPLVDAVKWFNAMLDRKV